MSFSYSPRTASEIHGKLSFKILVAQKMEGHRIMDKQYNYVQHMYPIDGERMSLLLPPAHIPETA